MPKYRERRHATNPSAAIAPTTSPVLGSLYALLKNRLYLGEIAFGEIGNRGWLAESFVEARDGPEGMGGCAGEEEMVAAAKAVGR